MLSDVEHRAPEGVYRKFFYYSFFKVSYVIEVAEHAGLVLKAKIKIDANPRDTKDRPDGGWPLPPSFKSGDVDQFRAI